MKVDITEKAKEELKELLKQKDIQNNTIRVFVQSIGWGGPSLSMALDKSKDEDILIENDGFKFIIDKNLAKDMSKVNIDYSDVWYRKGFRITSDLEMRGC